MELKNTEYEVDSQGVAIIWLNRPHRMNAWTGRLHTEYRHLLDKANRDRAVRAIIVTGRGKGFCGGFSNTTASTCYNCKGFRHRVTNNLTSDQLMGASPRNVEPCINLSRHDVLGQRKSG